MEKSTKKKLKQSSKSDWMKKVSNGETADGRIEKTKFTIFK